jgi:matrixin
MRSLSRILAGLVGLLGLALVMVSATVAPAAPAFPESGVLIYKDLRGSAVTEIRDADSGKILAQESMLGRRARRQAACFDRHRKFIGARWQAYEPYLINAKSLEGIAVNTAGDLLDPAAVAGDLVAAHAVWQTPMTTDCTWFDRTSRYQAIYGGSTDTGASLLDLESDGVNVVEFRSLAGTFCEGALACTIVDFEHRQINEVDMVFEKDLTSHGYPDFWSTEDTTLVTPDTGTFAVSDTAVHEFGHFLGLDHVDNSPELTMFPNIHDGAQSLGRGDMIGVVRLYRRGPVGPEESYD